MIATGDANEGYEMIAIAACVIGGVSMNGGRGSVVGSIFGALIYGLIVNMLQLLGSLDSGSRRSPVRSSSLSRALTVCPPPKSGSKRVHGYGKHEYENFRDAGDHQKVWPVTVLDNVDFDVERGEVLALVGANGAGKSTLMKILNGIYTPTSGEIRINGEAVELDNPRDAFNYGISMIHQELELVENLSVAENIFLEERR